MLSALSGEIKKKNWPLIAAETSRPKFRAIFGEDARFHLTRARALYAQGNLPEVFSSLESAINCPCVDSELAKVIYENLVQLITYHEYKRPVTSPILNARGPIILTMTTCKRYELFERTIVSLTSCADVQHIGSAIIVDDGSSEEDLIKMDKLMKKYFDEFQIITKHPDLRGHANSLNIIRSKLADANIPYFFHLEDDFEFLFRYPLIRKSIEVLESKETLGQCLFNNGYKESVNDDLTPWGARAQTPSGTTYYNHIFQPGINPCSYWNHFSLRPGIFRGGLWALVGPFITGDCSFEKDYSTRYVDFFTTAYLPYIYCEHIGRKTSERFCPEKQNAYSLNAAPQFGHYQWRPFLVHLERRRDRLSKLEIPSSLDHVQTFPAVDGSLLEPCAELTYLFRDNWRDLRSGVVGCALSHIKLWMKLVSEIHKTQVYFIFEDDVQFDSDFSHKWGAEWCAINDTFEPWDVVFIGNCRRAPAAAKRGWFTPKSSQEALEYSRGGTHAYVIKYTGALKLITYISQNGMVNAIDTVMQRCIDLGLRVHYCDPELATTSEVPGADTSDIGAQQEDLYNPDVDYSKVTWETCCAWINSIPPQIGASKVD